MKTWDTLADEATIQETVAALDANGIEAMVVESGEAARQKVLGLIPAGAQVMNMTSVTLETIGLAKEIVESGRYDAVRNRFAALDPDKDYLERQRLGAAPEWAVGSVHAVTQDGKVVIASNTGSQLPAYAYGASSVIWVAGAQKIVKDIDEAFSRIYEYVLPLEDKRAQAAYGMGSNVSKLLVVNKEIQKGRLTLIIVKEKLGF